MTHATATSEPISSDAVMVEVLDAQTSTPSDSPPTTLETAANDPSPLIGLQSFPIRSRSRSRSRGRSLSPPYRPRARIIHRGGRSRSPSDLPLITNSKRFNAVLASPDTCIETIASSALTYLTTHPFHSSDLAKLSWIFKIGVIDAWVQKPSPTNFQFDIPGRRYDMYDDGYNSRDVVPIARLGAALNVFKDDAAAAKVKFVTAVQGKRDAGWVKVVVSYTRQAAAVDIFHEILNGHSVLFVGAVLKDVAVPIEGVGRQMGKIQRVGSLKEAEEVGEGVVGVIC